MENSDDIILIFINLKFEWVFLKYMRQDENVLILFFGIITLSGDLFQVNDLTIQP